MFSPRCFSSLDMSAPKHFVNDPKHLVKESLQGLAYSNPNVKLDPEYRVLFRKDIDANKVHIVSVRS